MAEFDRRIFQLLQEAIPQMPKPIDKDYELMRLLAPALEWAREQYTTPREHAGWPNHRADERCRDLLEQLIHHECEGMGCSSTSACSPECEAGMTSRDPNKEAEYIERLLVQPREVLELLMATCGDCGDPLTVDKVAYVGESGAQVSCRAHAVYQAEVLRDAIAALGGLPWV